MRFRLLLAAVISLVCQACFSGQNDNYPFSVETEKEGDGHRIVARNAGPSPVSVRVALTSSYYIHSDRTFPIDAVVPPNGGLLYLAHIQPAMAGVGYTFTTTNTWLLGDFNAGQSPDAIYRLPYENGQVFRIGQAPSGPVTTHNTPESQFAVDIPMPEGTPIVAARDGTVIYTEANQVYGAQHPDMLSKANEVRVQHVDGTIAVYVHLKHGGVFAYAGQRVRAGDQIGLAGSTGYSSGPHLHFAVETVRKSASGFRMESLPFRFYVGNPPTAFSAQFGMLVKADYSSSAQIPGLEQQATQAIRAQPAQSPTATGTNELIVSFEVPPDFRTLLTKIQLWQWVVGMFGVVIFFVLIDKMRASGRRREIHLLKEPSFHSNSTEETASHGLKTKDKLILACDGDRLMAVRLMQYEYQRDPAIDDEVAALRAWQRIKRDRK